MKPVTEIKEREFEVEVRKTNQVVLMAFWAPWSRTCQVLRQVLDEIAAMNPGTVKIDLVNADDNPRLSMSYGIESVPTLLYFAGGRLRGRAVGTVSKKAILTQLEIFSNL